MTPYFCDNEWAIIKAFPCSADLKQSLFFHQNSGVWFYIQDFQFLLKLGSGKLSWKVLHNFDMRKYIITLRLRYKCQFSRPNLILQIIWVEAMHQIKDAIFPMMKYCPMDVAIAFLLEPCLTSPPSWLIELLNIQIVSLHWNKSKWND